MSWNFSGNQPIYTQLVEQVQLKILSGEYRAGDKLQSIRDLAAEAAVNPNTMQRALAELEQSGLVYTQRTSGRFITDDQERISQVRRSYVKKSVLECIEQLKGLGYTTDEMINLMTSIIEEESK